MISPFVHFLQNSQNRQKPKKKKNTKNKKPHFSIHLALFFKKIKKKKKKHLFLKITKMDFSEKKGVLKKA